MTRACSATLLQCSTRTWCPRRVTPGRHVADGPDVAARWCGRRRRRPRRCRPRRRCLRASRSTAGSRCRRRRCPRRARCRRTARPSRRGRCRSRSVTPTPHRTSTPSARCSRATSSPICSPSTEASGVGCGSTSTTSTPQLAQAGRHLAADEPRADDHGACRAEPACLRNARLSSNVPQHADALEVGERRNSLGHQARCDHQLVVADDVAVGQRHRLRVGVQLVARRCRASKVMSFSS